MRAHPEFADGSVFVSTVLREPSRAALADYELTGRAPARESKVVLYDRRKRLVIEAAVSLGGRQGPSWRAGARRPAQGEPRGTSRPRWRRSRPIPRWQAALRRRGVTDFSYVEVQPWPPGFTDERDAAHGARVAKALTWVGYSATDNPFARPVEHLVATVDLDSATVLAVDDHEAVPLPPFAGNYVPELASRRRELPGDQRLAAGC